MIGFAFLLSVVLPGTVLCLEQESSSITMSRLQQMKTLLNDVKTNRHRIFAVLVGINNAMVDGDGMEYIIKRLAQEGLVSEDQFQKIAELEEITLPVVAAIIKDTKIGQYTRSSS